MLGHGFVYNLRWNVCVYCRILLIFVILERDCDIAMGTCPSDHQFGTLCCVDADAGCGGTVVVYSAPSAPQIRQDQDRVATSLESVSSLSNGDNKGFGSKESTLVLMISG